jgi:hypothetical protein
VSQVLRVQLWVPLELSGPLLSAAEQGSVNIGTIPQSMQLATKGRRGRDFSECWNDLVYQDARWKEAGRPTRLRIAIFAANLTVNPNNLRKESGGGQVFQLCLSPIPTVSSAVGARGHFTQAHHSLPVRFDKALGLCRNLKRDAFHFLAVRGMLKCGATMSRSGWEKKNAPQCQAMPSSLQHDRGLKPCNE